MKLSVSFGVFLLLSYVMAQDNGQTWSQRMQEIQKNMELRQKQIENRGLNRYRWKVVMDDEKKTLVKQGAIVNTLNKAIIFWSGDRILEGIGYNRTVMIQDSEGLMAVVPLPGVQQRLRAFPRGGQIFFQRTKRQAPPFETGRSQFGGGMGREQFGGGMGRGLRGGVGRGLGTGMGLGLGGGMGRGLGGRMGRGFVGGMGRGPFGQGMRGVGIGTRGQRFGGFGRRFGARRVGGPCYIIPAKLTYDDALNMILKNNATGKVDILAETLDFVASSSPMTADTKTAFTTAHPDLARFCGTRKLFDAQTITAGSDLSIDKVINAVTSWGRFKIRIKDDSL